MTTTSWRGSRAWPVAGISSGALLLISTLLPFPTVTPAMLRTPSDELVSVLGDDAGTIYVRNGPSWLCIALLVVFVTGLYRHLADLVPGGTTAAVALAGGASRLQAPFSSPTGCWHRSPLCQRKAGTPPSSRLSTPSATASPTELKPAAVS